MHLTALLFALAAPLALAVPAQQEFTSAAIFYKVCRTPNRLSRSQTANCTGSFKTLGSFSRDKCCASLIPEHA